MSDWLFGFIVGMMAGGSFGYAWAAILYTGIGKRSERESGG
jgi:hypothetical protein